MFYLLSKSILLFDSKTYLLYCNVKIVGFAGNSPCSAGLVYVKEYGLKIRNYLSGGGGGSRFFICKFFRYNHL
jgi:hypothetical protein